MTNNLPIQIRPYRLSDQSHIGQLFYDTVHTVNRKDYTQHQVDAWAPDTSKTGQFPRPLEKNYSYIAEKNGLIIGFGDISSDGYLDRLFVHKDFQRCGVASKLLKVLESKAKDLHLTEITTEASITAKPFFLAKGYLVKEEQVKVVKDTTLTNFKMYKKIS
jgi:GNAT superfamily N-acetyltransferase